MASKKSYYEIKNVIKLKGSTLLSKEYKNSTTQLSIQCACGNIFSRDFKAIRVGLGMCRECTESYRKNSERSFDLNDIKKLLNKYKLNSLTDISTIKSAKNRIDVVCSCGNIFKTDIYNLKRGNSTKCKSCHSFNFWKIKKRNIDTIRIIIEKFGGTLLDENYVDNKTPLRIKCSCGNIFNRRLNNVLSYESSKCQMCKPRASKGERKISEILIQNNIKFESQKTFANCKLAKPLRFDFFIPCMNTLIEYDGIQHFEPVEIFNGEKEFLQVRKRDEYKNNYCRLNSIKLLRISYKDLKNIREILIKNKIIPSQAS